VKTLPLMGTLLVEGHSLQVVRDEGRDSKTQEATKGESTPRRVPSKPTTLSPRLSNLSTHNQFPMVELIDLVVVFEL
jgi:hypothetical protein